MTCALVSNSRSPQFQKSARNFFVFPQANFENLWVKSKREQFLLTKLNWNFKKNLLWHEVPTEKKLLSTVRPMIVASLVFAYNFFLRIIISAVQTNPLFHFVSTHGFQKFVNWVIIWWIHLKSTLLCFSGKRILWLFI